MTNLQNFKIISFLAMSLNLFFYLKNCSYLLLIIKIFFYFQIDPTVLPYSAMGPTRTPAVTNYDSPDGEYFNITKKYDGE